MTKASVADDRASERIDWEIGSSGLRISYQPIFSVSRGAVLKLCALRAGALATPDTTTQEQRRLAAPSALRHVAASASDRTDLYLDLTVAGDWDVASLAAWVDRNKPSLPGCIYVEAGAASVPLAPHSRLRYALVSDGCDEELDLSIERFRPGVVRIEGGWFANLAQHKATRGLLATLVGMLKRRGVRTLFDRLDDARLVSLAIDCGADWVQGDALAPAFAAGSRVEDRVAIAGANVVPVHFGHRGGMTA